MREDNKSEDELINIKIYDSKGINKKSGFGALKEIGSFTQEDELKGQLEDWYNQF